MKRTPEQKQFVEELIRDFGDPTYKQPKLKFLTFNQGVKCNLNPDCRKVNTSACDLPRCMRKKRIFGSSNDL